MAYAESYAVDIGIITEGGSTVLVTLLDVNMDPIGSPTSRGAGTWFGSTPCAGFKVAHPDPGVSAPWAFGVDRVTRYDTASTWADMIPDTSTTDLLDPVQQALPDTGTPTGWMVVEDQDYALLGNDMASAGLTCVTGYMTDWNNAIFAAPYTTTKYAITGALAAIPAGTASTYGYESSLPLGEIVVMFGTQPSPPPPRPRRAIGGNPRLRQRQTPFIA